MTTETLIVEAAPGIWRYPGCLTMYKLKQLLASHLLTNSTQSVGIWGANPSSQVGNIFTANSSVTFLLYQGGSVQTAQVTYVSGMFTYIAQ